MVTNIGTIRPVRIEVELSGAYLDYAMSVIVSRALPDIRDGLKPVQRRILYAMLEMGIRPNSSYRKSARIVGEVLGKFHPHGDAPVYEAMVRMAQPFSMRMPLVDGQGNFGSVDDDPPAAMRYTEARLAAIAEEMIADIDEDTVDFVDNFDGTLQEPVVVPARLPNLLVNGASGIAVGMATNIPPHNLSEVCDAIVHLLDNPAATHEDLMQFVLGPDFPTGALIIGREGIVNACTTGKGRVVVRAKAEIEQSQSTGRRTIIVSELPFQLNKASLVEKIAHLVKDRRLDGITEIRDESDRDGLRVVIELRRDAQPEMVLNNLYKHTPMQTSFSVNMLALVEGTPKVVTLKDILVQYIYFRQRVVVRRSEYRLRKAQERDHVLEGLLVALNNLDDVIALIRSSKDAESARTGLMETYDLDLVQASAILDMALRRIAALESQRILQEHQELQNSIEGLEALLADPKKVLATVRQETETLKEKFGTPRLTQILDEEPEAFKREDLEPHLEVVVTLSQTGYIKRMPANTYRAQHRGGKGIKGQVMREDDPLQYLVVADTHNVLLFFTDRGRVFALRGYDIPQALTRNTRGVPLANLISLGEKEQVNAILAVASIQQDTYLLLATRRGLVKRMPLKHLSNIRSSGLAAMNLPSEDSLVSALLADEGGEVVMVSEQGKSIRFPISQVTPHSRQAGGIKGMRLERTNQVIAMVAAAPNGRLLVVSQGGFGKMTSLAYYKTQQRGGVGLTTFKITSKTGPLAAAAFISDNSDVFLVSNKAQLIRIELEEIAVRGRITQGTTLWKPHSGDAVAAIASVRPPPPLQPSSATPAAATGTDGKAVQEATDQETASLEDDSGEPEPDHSDEPPSVESNGANQGDTLRLFPE